MVDIVMQSQPKGWYVPRNLPHFDTPEVLQAVTFRLADSLPRNAAARYEAESEPHRRRRIGDELDRGFGSCILARPAYAEIVENALLFNHAHRYRLHAWVIMPNHVHVLVEPGPSSRLAEIMQAWKSWTAKEINRARGTSGAVWQREYFDRFMRDERQAHATIHYIEHNPVKAGLVADPRDWKYGSARRRTDSGLQL